MQIITHLTAEQSRSIAALADRMARLEQEKRKLEQERVALIARLNKPHLVARRWIRMRLIRLFN